MIHKARRGLSISVGFMGGACTLEVDLEVSLGGSSSCGDRSMLERQV